MALITCPECGRRNVSDSAEACPNCGYGIRTHFEKVDREKTEESKQLDKDSEEQILSNISAKNKESKPANTRIKIYAMVLIIAFIIIIIGASVVRNYSNAKKVERFVQSGNYLEAYEKLDRKSMDMFVEEEILDKAEIIGGLEYNYKYANEKEWDKVTNYMCVVLSSIGTHQKLLDWDLYDYTEEMVLDSIQQMENYRDKIFDDTVSEMLYEEYKDSDNQRVEPYRTDNPEGATEYIEYLISTIDNSKTEKFEKDNFNKQNPLQITKKEVSKDGSYWYCKGTISNVSSNTYSSVRVKVTYYDDEGNVLTTDWTYAIDSVGIKGGENKQFEIMTKVIGNVEKYKVEIIDYKK